MKHQPRVKHCSGPTQTAQAGDENISAGHTSRQSRPCADGLMDDLSGHQGSTVKHQKNTTE